MSPRKDRALALSFALLPLVTLACSDSSKPSGSGTPATTTAATTAPTASSTATATADAAPSCAIDEAQYTDWDDWGKGCGFAVPKTTSALPPRIAWEPCGAAVGLPGCRKLRPRAGATLHGVRAGAKRIDVVEVGFVEECVTATSKHALLVLAEADGPTLAAFASKGHEPGKCDVELLSLNQGAYTARISEAGDAGPGAFVGAPTQTSKPQLLRSWEAGQADKGAVTSDVRWMSFGPNGAKTARWGDPAPETVTDNALNVEPVMHHGSAFWADVDMFVMKTAPAMEKLRGADAGDATSSLGTDGQSIAFTHRGSGDDPPLSLAAADFTTEADKLAPKRILPLPRRLDSAPWTVGCGRAAHAMAGNEVLVARLKDGLSWTVSSSGCDTGGLCLQKPIALTCSEVYFSAATKDGKEESIVRVPFSGLGKGKEPPAAPSPLAAPPSSASSSTAPTP